MAEIVNAIAASSSVNPPKKEGLVLPVVNRALSLIGFVLSRKNAKIDMRGCVDRAEIYGQIFDESFKKHEILMRDARNRGR